MMMTITSVVAMIAGFAGAVAPPPAEVTVTKDNTEITSSCRVVIPPGTVIADVDGNGVIRVKGDGITVEFAAGSELRGAGPGTAGDAMTGQGIVVEGGRRVTIKGARVHGYKVGIRASKTAALTIDGADVSGNYRQRLRSTPQAEDGGDWLYPHHNDGGEWAKNYGAAILVEDSSQATIRSVVCRRGQNGIVLDRVNDSKIYDNDCSFLSGWGVAMWRSNKNVVSRNALDFCVRGHSEGVYNRGQDSAGLLMFEQCSNNVIAENSVTHGGDGVFSFAGSEAIGEGSPPAGFNYTRKGCNDNVFIRNDFSFASAHGLELTFSHGNTIAENRFVENAICGIWGGYSQDTVITGNTFVGNGGMAYGLERGAINMEHASNNRIFLNTFVNNKVAVHLWWDDDSGLLEKPGVKRNYKGVSGNVIAENDVKVDPRFPFKKLPESVVFFAWQFRDVTPRATGGSADGGEKGGSPTESPAKAAKRKEEHFKNNQVSQNVVLMDGVNGVESAFDPGTEPRPTGPTPGFQPPRLEVLGQTRPVGARTRLAGRGNIIMDEWGPWDHASPIMRSVTVRGASHVYEVLGSGPEKVVTEIEPSSLIVQAEPSIGSRPWKLTVSGGGNVVPYVMTVKVGDGFERKVRGTLIPAKWNAVFFPWTEASDPRKAENMEAWRALSTGGEARSALVGELAMRFGGGGPKDLKLGRVVTESALGANHFGMIATTRLSLPAGRWRFKTLSDDGVRVVVDGKAIIENWTWHAPTEDMGVFVQAKEGLVDVKVEYFEIDGHAVLELGLERE